MIAHTDSGIPAEAEFRRVLASSLTTEEAAALCGMRPASFRGAMTRLRQADPEQDYRTATRPVVLWSEAQVRYWLGTRPGSGNWR